MILLLSELSESSCLNELLRELIEVENVVDSASGMKTSKTHDNGKLDNSFKAVQCRSIDHFFSKTEVNSLLACLSSGFI